MRNVISYIYTVHKMTKLMLQKQKQTSVLKFCGLVSLYTFLDRIVAVHQNRFHRSHSCLNLQVWLISFMLKFTSFEITDMHFDRIITHMKQGTCAEKYPPHNLPCRQIFANIYCYIRGKCSFVKSTVDLGRLVTVRRLELKKAVFN